MEDGPAVRWVDRPPSTLVDLSTCGDDMIFTRVVEPELEMKI